MTKKLNITAITNELEESAFFPSKKNAPVSPTPPSVPEETKTHVEDRPTIEPKPTLSERANDRILERPNGKRIISRKSFEIYEDQMTSLRTLSFKEKMEGKLGSMSSMVREAIDEYLKERSSEK
jgi:hypothetical protein